MPLYLLKSKEKKRGDLLLRNAQVPLGFERENGGGPA